MHPSIERDIGSSFWHYPEDILLKPRSRANVCPGVDYAPDNCSTTQAINTLLPTPTKTPSRNKIVIILRLDVLYLLHSVKS